MYFEKNAEALLAADPLHGELLDRLRQTAPPSDAEIAMVQAQSDNDQYTLHYRGIWLHDPANPAKEARKAFRASCKAREDRVHLILGLDLGYALDEAFQNSPGHILVYEPDRALLRFTLENVDLSEMLGSGRVQLADSHFTLLNTLRPRIYSDYDLDVLILPGSASRLAADTPILVRKIKALITDWARDYRTVQRFHPVWMEQFFNNFPYFATNDTIECVFNRFDGKPAIIISRGPSLDAALDDIAAVADCAVLVAVGSAVRRLWERGITPDFAVFYEANGIAEQLHGIPADVLEKITFIMCPSTQVCAYEAPSRGKLVFFSHNGKQMADWMDLALGRKHLRLEGGGTVSLIALELAMAMGCNPIILTGQDLAFPNNQVYAGGTELCLDEQGHMALTRTETLYAEPEAMTTVIGQNGETLPALSAYAGFIRHFESLAVKAASGPNPVALYNASIGGARIEGYALASLGELRKRLGFTPWKAPFALPEPPVLTPSQTSDRTRRLSDALHQLDMDLTETIAFCGELREGLPEALDAPTDAGSLRVLEDAVWEATQRFFHFLHAKPFVGFLAMFEVIPYKQRFKAFTEADTFNPGIRDDLVAALEGSARVLREQHLPWVERARRRLAEPVANRK